MLRASELPLRPGAYRLRVDASGPVQRVRIVSGRPEEMVIDDTVAAIEGAGGDFRFEPDDAPVSLEIQCARDTDLVTGVFLERLDGAAGESLAADVALP